MLGTGLQFRRNHREDDRFYVPLKGRKSYHNQPDQEQLRRPQSEVSARQSHSKKEKPMDTRQIEEQTRSEEFLKPLEVESVDSPLCNLKRFLESVTPSVPAQYLSKTTMRGWSTCDVEFEPYFELGDLWESFKEWSAYGAGVPIVLDGTDGGIQYYVPYLSGLQIYGNANHPIKSRRIGEEGDSDDFRDSSSDGSSDCEPLSEVARGLNGLSLHNQNAAHQEDSSSDDGECLRSQGSLLFEYYEQEAPYSREPLADKISDLIFTFPELKTLRSCDIQSSSWISVAWYPIYRIPTGTTLKDLGTCFLTFHSLHTPATGTLNAQAPVITYPTEVDEIPKISLPVFGMSTYKFKGSLWSPKADSDRQLANSLLQAADKWLRLLRVNHPDFLFFSRR